MSIEFLTGDCRDHLALMPSNSVHCVVTSPPYWGLRDYGTAKWEGGDPNCDHVMPVEGGISGNKGNSVTHPGRFVDCRCGARRIDSQIGLEPTFTEFIDKMVEVFREVRRVLRPDGTLWLNLGDSYASGEIGRHDGYNPTREGGSTTRKPFGPRKRHSRPRITGQTGGTESVVSDPGSDGAPTFIKPKDLVGIPWRLAFALQEDGWWLRQDIIWSKPNPMPESVTDRCTKAHEYLFLLTKSARYYFDAEAIKESAGENTHSRGSGDGGPKMRERTDGVKHWHNTEIVTSRNKRSVWEIATSPFPQAHFATFPPALVEPCIKAGTSEKGCCAKCGAPWARQTKATFVPQHDVNLQDGVRGAAAQKPMDVSNGWQGFPRGTTDRETLGWQPTCACHGHFEEREGPPDWISEQTGERKKIRVYVPDEDSPPPKPCTVLDPFGGAGTTALVADRLQRNAILNELNPDYMEMAKRRIAEDAGELLRYINQQVQNRSAPEPAPVAIQLSLLDL